ncbi:SWIM zinc finger family protein [Halorussus halophilus]|uniref:SWIM zinc finger family protein n=1 Tax=Halorussus halophilus TaxID=2650975 RepID=UPI001300E2B8|nr:SWIM zinc finger family protein [Halorussus halophilus]
MTTPLDRLQTTNRVRKRAQYEAFEFELRNGSVRVRNGSHADPENHEYTIRIEDDLPTACTCPADMKYSGACKHRVAVAIRQPILDAVRHQQVLADGGVRSRTSSQSHDSEKNSEEPADAEDDACDCADLSGGFPCWECYRSGRRDFPE